MKVVSNSTPLIALARINELKLLHDIFGSIIIPPAVYREVVIEGAGRPGMKEVKDAPWVTTIEVQNHLAVALLRTDLDPGESEAVVLAKELEADYLLIDEGKARRVAKASGIRIMGTLGVVALAAQKGLLPDIDSILDRLQHEGFRFTDAVREKVKERFRRE
ncbi:MAG: DUF3368 domain-containing protein, partial [Moorellaceae bacterium]